MNAQPQRDESLASHDCLPSIKERRRLGQSIWMLLLLREWRRSPDMYVLSGDSIRAEQLAHALGVGERQARRELQRLRRTGYIELQNTGRGFRIRLVRSGSPV